MKNEASEVVRILQRIRDGGDITFDDAYQKVNWNVSNELAPLLQEIYQQLQMFGSDKDIRSNDQEYDATYRNKMKDFLEKLERALE